MELKEKYDYITTGTSFIGDTKISSFIMVENERYIDLNNLHKYTIKQLKSIYGGRIGGSPKKQDYINLILRNQSNEITQMNRNIKLKELGL